MIQLNYRDAKPIYEVVTELLFLATDEDSLKTRIEQLAKGGEAQ